MVAQASLPELNGNFVITWYSGTSGSRDTFAKRYDSNGNELPPPVNIGNPNEFSIQELANQIISLTGSTSKIVYLPLPEDDPLQRQPNIDLAREQLGWEPKIQLKEGLERTIEYFKEKIV